MITFFILFMQFYARAYKRKARKIPVEVLKKEE